MHDIASAFSQSYAEARQKFEWRQRSVVMTMQSSFDGTNFARQAGVVGPGSSADHLFRCQSSQGRGQSAGYGGIAYTHFAHA